MNSNCSNLLDLRNLQEEVKKAFCYQKLFWPFTVWINCSSDLKKFANSWPSASNFKSFSWSVKQFFLTVGQNNFNNKIPFIFRSNPRRLLFASLMIPFFIFTTAYRGALVSILTVELPGRPLNTMEDLAKNNITG